jgi:FkbM family methyltransferase
MTEIDLKKVYSWKKSIRTSVYSYLKNIINAHQGRRYLFPGFLSLISRLCAALQPKGPILIKLENLDLVVNGRDDVMTPEILVQRIHEPEETMLLKKSIKPGMTVLDLGANIGYFSVIAGLCAGARGKVYAFEPEPVNGSYLSKNIALNHLENIKVIPKIVSNTSGVASLYLDKGNHGAHTCAKGNIQTAFSHRLEVESTTLDEFVETENLDRVDFIKMDVQGAEGLVFEKALLVINKFPVKILMEFWPEGLKRMGTEPAELLSFLARFFSFRIMGDSQEKQSPQEVLKKAQHAYLNLFLEKF